MLHCYDIAKREPSIWFVIINWVRTHMVCRFFQALGELVNEGFIRSIGMSNFTCDQISRLKRCSSIPVSVVQVEYHAYLQQHELRHFCQENDIVLQAFAPLCSPAGPPGYEYGHILLDIAYSQWYINIKFVKNVFLVSLLINLLNIPSSIIVNHLA